MFLSDSSSDHWSSQGDPTTSLDVSVSRCEATLLSRDGDARLEAVYERDRYPTTETLERLADALTASHQQLQAWFRKRRCRDRKTALKKPPPLRLHPSIMSSCAIKSPAEPDVPDHVDTDDARRRRTELWCENQGTIPRASLETNVLSKPRCQRGVSELDCLGVDLLSGSSLDSKFPFIFFKKPSRASDTASPRHHVSSPISFLGHPRRRSSYSSFSSGNHGNCTTSSSSYLSSPCFFPAPHNSQTSADWSLLDSATSSSDSIFFSRRFHVMSGFPLSYSSSSDANSDGGHLGNGDPESSISQNETKADDVVCSHRFVPMERWSDADRGDKISLSALSSSYSSFSSLSTPSPFCLSPPPSTSHLISSYLSSAAHLPSSDDQVDRAADWLWDDMLEKCFSPSNIILSPIMD